MINRINVSIVGLGNVGSEYLKFFKKQKKIKKNFIFDIFKNLSFFKKHKKIIIEKNRKELISKSDVVLISNYDKDHEKYIVDSIKQKKNIFVEKPMCTSFSQLANIIKQLEKNDYKKFLMSNFVLRESEILKRIYRQVKKGDFGKIYFFEGDYLYGRLNKILNGWRGKDKNYSVMLGGGIHMIDLMVLFLNDLPIEVISTGNKIVTKKSKFNNHDFVVSNFKFKNGALAKISANFGCVHNHQHVIKIYGTKKTFIYDDKGARIYYKRDFNRPKFLKVKKLYKGKDCLLKKYLSQLNNSLNKNLKSLNKELNIVNLALYAEHSLRKNKKQKIRPYNLNL